jgi:hypothetical protein
MRKPPPRPEKAAPMPTPTPNKTKTHICPPIIATDSWPVLGYGRAAKNLPAGMTLGEWGLPSTHHSRRSGGVLATSHIKHDIHTTVVVG